MAKVKITIDQSSVRALNQRDGLVYQGVAKAAGWVRDESKTIIRDEGRTGAGRLQNSINSWEANTNQGEVLFSVGSQLPYAIFQHEGVKGPVLPRRAKVLRFRPKGGGAFVFARSTKGFEGIFFLTRARDRLTPKNFT